MNAATQLSGIATRPANLGTTVVKTGKAVTLRNVSHGHHALIEAGKRVVLWGASKRYRAGKPGIHFTPYRVEFRVGAVAVCGGYNLTYTGTIISIGAKTITVEEYPGTSNARRHRLSIERFSSLNDHFDLAEIQKRNAEWRD